MDSPTPAGRARAARPFRLLASAQSLTLALVLALAGDAAALTLFTPGTPAKASEVNANFAELAGRMDALEQLPQRLQQLESSYAADDLDVDCVADSLALQNVLAHTAGPGDRLVVAGECSGPIKVADRGLSLRSGSPVARIVTTSDTPALDIAAADVVVDGFTVRTAAGTDTIGIRISHGDAVLDNVTVNKAETGVLVTIDGAALVRDSEGIQSITVTDGGVLLLDDDNGTLSLAIRRGAGATVLPHGDTTTLSGLEITEDARFSAMAEVAITGRLVLARNAVAAFEAGVDLAYRNAAAPDEPGILVEHNASLNVFGGIVDTTVYVGGGSDVTTTGVDFIDSTGRDGGGLLKIDAASILDMTGGKAGALTTTTGSATAIDGVTLEGAANGIALRVIGGHVTTRGGSSLKQDAVIEDNGTLSMEDTTLTGDLIALRNSSIRIGDDVDVQATRASSGSCPLSPRAGIRLDMGSMLTLDTAATGLSGFLEVSRFSVLDPGSITQLPDVDAEYETTDQLPNVRGISPCSSG